MAVEALLTKPLVQASRWRWVQKLEITAATWEPKPAETRISGSEIVDQRPAVNRRVIWLQGVTQPVTVPRKWAENHILINFLKCITELPPNCLQKV